MEEHEKLWQPLATEEVAHLFSSASFPIWIAGGIALELAIGHRIRDHADVDVLVLRRDHIAARAFLSDWDCWVADPPGALREWPLGQALRGTVHDIWCRRSRDDAWRMQLMLDEADGNNWVSRRDAEVRGSFSEITRTTAAGVRYLAPHIQLYYKAKNLREKDQIDFDAVINSGIDLDVKWLRAAISSTCGTQHPWLSLLPK